LVAGAGTRRTVGSKAGSRSEDGALRLGAGDSLSPRGGRDKQRAVAVGDLRVALPAATLLSAPRPDTYFSVRGRGSARRQAGRHKRHPPVTTTQPDKSSVVCFSLVFGSWIIGHYTASSPVDVALFSHAKSSKPPTCLRI
jgi:hypothetical protein